MTGVAPDQTLAPSRAVTRGPRHHSFGYYDKSPWDASGRYLLALQAPFCERSPGSDDAATLGVVDLADGDRLQPFAQTLAWNWQQGCMLRWLPPGAERQVIYNDRQDGRFVAVIRDALNGSEVRRLPLPVYALSHDGRQALSLNFARLHHQRPGYGYAGVPDPWRQVAEPDDDGIWWMDMRSGEHRLAISVAQVAGMNSRAAMDGAIHRFNHLLFSPNDERFIFLHRWRPAAPASPPSPGRRLMGALRGVRRLIAYDPELAGLSPWRRLRFGLRGLQRVLARTYGVDDAGFTRLCTARPDGSEIAIVADEGMVSHFDWRDPTHILAWARHRGIDGFYLYHDRHRDETAVDTAAMSNDATAVDPVAMPRDGHCSYSPDSARRWILNDTGPDDQDHRDLYLYDTQQSRRIELGRFHSPPRLTRDTRCDLHPRWHPNGRQVCIDSAHEGTRQLYVVDVDRIVGNQEATDVIRRWPRRGALPCARPVGAEPVDAV